jgi:hypothetical protein
MDQGEAALACVDHIELNTTVGGAAGLAIAAAAHSAAVPGAGGPQESVLSVAGRAGERRLLSTRCTHAPLVSPATQTLSCVLCVCSTWRIISQARAVTCSSKATTGCTSRRRLASPPPSPRSSPRVTPLSSAERTFYLTHCCVYRSQHRGLARSFASQGGWPHEVSSFSPTPAR